MVLDDDAIVSLCRQGRPEGFAQLLLAYQERVYQRAYSFVRSREDALDITQEVFLRVIRGLPGFTRGRPLWPWLRRITTNVCLNFLRSRPVFRARRALRRALADGVPGTGEDRR